MIVNAPNDVKVEQKPLKGFLLVFYDSIIGNVGKLPYPCCDKTWTFAECYPFWNYTYSAEEICKFHCRGEFRIMRSNRLQMPDSIFLHCIVVKLFQPRSALRTINYDKLLPTTKWLVHIAMSYSNWQLSCPKIMIQLMTPSQDSSQIAATARRTHFERIDGVFVKEVFRDTINVHISKQHLAQST